MFVSSACMEAHTHTYSHTLTILGRGPDPQCKALFLVSIISNTEINIFFLVYKLKGGYRITLIVLVIGKAQFRRAMLSCDSSY